MFRRLATALGGTLVLFHGWLLGSQAWDGELGEPGLVLRWVIAAGLVTALAGLRRRGDSIVLGRKAISIWLLAALLHGPAVAGAAAAHDSPALPESVTALVQIAAASVAVGLGLALLIALFIGRLALAFDALAGVGIPHVRASFSARVLPFAPRPPPSHASLAIN
jgi:hypothetical protein